MFQGGSIPLAGLRMARPAALSLHLPGRKRHEGTAEPSSLSLRARAAVPGVHQEMLQGAGCKVRVQGRGRNNEGFREGGCQGLQLCQGRQLVMEKGGAEAWKERKEHPRAQKFTEGCVGAGRSRRGTGLSGEAQPGKESWGQAGGDSSMRIPSLQAHALKSQSGRRT